MGARKVIPRVFIAVSLLYLLFTFSLEERRMIGDVRGRDPGSRAIPVGIAFVMLATSGYLTYQERKQVKEEGGPLESSIKKLIGLTILLSILYILSFRFLGFVLSTHLLLFTLVYFSYEQDVRWPMVPGFFLGLLLSTGFMILFYSIGRYITHHLFLASERSDLPVLAGKLFTSGATSLVLCVIFVTLLFLMRKALRAPRIRVLLAAAFVAIGITEFLYIVFKQLFFVSLAQGLIGW